MRDHLAFGISGLVQVALLGTLALLDVPRRPEVDPWEVEMVFERGQAPAAHAISIASPTPEEPPLDRPDRSQQTTETTPSDVQIDLPERVRTQPELKVPEVELAQADLDPPPLELEPTRRSDQPEIPPPADMALKREQTEALAPPPPSVEMMSLPAEIGAEVDEPPRPLPTNPPTLYPAGPLQRRIGGTVTLCILVGADGQVENVVVEQSSGVPELDEAAVANRLRWRFTPAVRDGHPVAFTVRQQVVFRPSS